MTPVASGSSRTPAAGRATGCCRWPSPGLAALSHRGAFGADGESSDGAGVALPLDRSLLALLAGEAAASAGAAGSRPGIVSLFLPRARGAERRARALVEATFLETGLAIAAWRSVPFDVTALGASAADSRPAFAHAIVERPSRGADDPRPLSDDAFERRLVVARRRLEIGGARGRRRPGRDRRPVGLGADDRLQGPRHRRPAARSLPGPARAVERRLRGLPPALRDEHAPGLAARPTVPLDRPQRRDQHGPWQSRAGPRPVRRRHHLRDRPLRSWPPGRSCPPTAPIRSRSTRRSSSSPRPAGP